MKPTIADTTFVSSDTEGVVLNMEAHFGIAEAQDNQYGVVMKLVDRKTNEARTYILDPYHVVDFIGNLANALAMIKKYRNDA